MAGRAKVRYAPVPSKEDLWDRETPSARFPESDDLRYRYEVQETIPWRSIMLAIFLLGFGTILLIVSHLIFTGHMGGDSSQAYGLLILGMLVFLPGFYETRIAYYSWRGFKGYKFSRIPA